MTIQEEKDLKRHQKREESAARALMAARAAIRKAQLEHVKAKHEYERANKALLAYKERIS